LLAYAEEHPHELFLLKLHFDDHPNSGSDTHRLTKNVTARHRHTITHRLDPSSETHLGQTRPPESLKVGCNAAILANHPSKDTVASSDPAWNHKANVNSKRGSTSSWQTPSEILKKNPAGADPTKITTPQTNLLGPKLGYPGPPGVAQSSNKETAKAIAQDPNFHGVITVDFVGDPDLSSTNKYIDIINNHNAQYLVPYLETSV